MKLIDAEPLEEKIEKVIKHGVAVSCGNHPVSAELMFSWLMSQPKVDAVPVVRCKDCAVPHNQMTGCPRVFRIVEPEWFCADGELKEDKLKRGRRNMTIDYKNAMTDQKISVLLNAIEQMAADTDDKGETSFGIRLTLEDAYILTRLKKLEHGHWETAIGYDCNRTVMCSECQKMNYEPSNYCPHCGAKMDGEQDD